MNTDPCTCPDFQRTLERGTDSEGYYPAIEAEEGQYFLGSIMETPLKFCPYCGKPLQLPKN